VTYWRKDEILMNTAKEFETLRAIVRPWLGEVRTLNLPANSADITAWIKDIVGHGFRSLELVKNNTAPDWIRPEWRTFSGVQCPRCQTEIHALLKSHRQPGSITKAPYVFCRCIRLNPSRLPSLEFFISHWNTVLEVLAFFERVAGELQQERELERKQLAETYESGS
jgi:hypothetical protein